MLVQKSALLQELPALDALSNVDICEALAALGLPVDGLHGQGDAWVIDVDVTANRGDACSHRGLARDLSAKGGWPLTPLPHRPLTEGVSQLPIALEAAWGQGSACPLYATALLMLGDRQTTPPEVVDFLGALGSSAKQWAAVDASNELLHRYGQPTHAFDFDKLQGGIAVRWALAGETLVTLDGLTRSLTPDDLVIADARGPIALAGVMGGEATKVTETTRRVLLESAYFDPQVVRRMAHRHGLHSDASFRFGRGVDPAMATVVRDMLVERLQTWADATLASAWTVGQLPRPWPEVVLQGTTLARMAGEPVALEEAGDLLRRLGCNATVHEGALRVTAPSWRHDLHIESDYAEEVLRLRGYDRIPCVLPPLEEAPQPLSETFTHQRRMAKRMAHLGFQETVTLGFVSAEMDAVFASPDNPSASRTLRNPLGQEYAVMRASLMGSLKAVAEANVRQGARMVQCFEVAPVYRLVGGSPQEVMALAYVWGGTLGGEDYLSPARSVQAADLLGVANDLGWTNQGNVPLGQGFSGKVQALGEGLFGMELPLSAIPMAQVRPIPTFQSFSRFPVVERDLSLLVSLDQSYSALHEALIAGLKAVAGDVVQDVRCVDVFRHKSLPAGKQAWLMRMRFQAADRTLTSEEVDTWMQAALRYAIALGAEIRR